MSCPSRRSPTSGLLAALLAAACAGAGVERVPGELRVIVQFSRSVAPGDPALLREMRIATGAEIILSSMMTDTEAAYWIKCDLSDPSCDVKMARLMLVPGIAYVQPDRYRYPSEPSR